MESNGGSHGHPESTPARADAQEAGGEPRSVAGGETSSQDGDGAADVIRAAADQTASDADQTASDSDQTGSDSDQTASDSDQARSESDQRGSNRDQAAADREHAEHPDAPDGAYEDARAERLETTRARRRASDARARTAVERLAASTARDASADRRDLTAAMRDRAADESDAAAQGLADAVARAGGIIKAAREEVASARERAAADRARAAEDRRRAASDRAAAADRGIAIAGLRAVSARHGEEIDRIAAGIAHNVNNLMAIVVGYANRELRRATTAQARDDLEQIVHAADRATAVTRQLLEFAGLAKSGRGQVEPGQAIRELAPTLEELIGPGVALEVQVEAPGAPLAVDSAEFELMLMNLALNAREAMADGGTLTIAGRARVVSAGEGALAGLAPGDYVEISVSDSGAGIPSAVLGHVTEPFFTTKGPEHAGLGLATVAGIAAAAGGSLDIDSGGGSGTTVRITLPHVPPAGASG